MRSYSLELYLPRGKAATLDDAVAKARLAAEELSREGSPVRYLRSMYLTEDEICFHVFEAPSRDSVAEAARRAGLADSRITETVERSGLDTKAHRGG